MKVAVTGITGHLGSAVLRELLDRNYPLRALVRNRDNRCLKGLTIDVVEGDVLDRPSLNSLMEGCDALIHCAGIISVNGDPDGKVHLTNVSGTRNLFEVACEHGIRRAIHISSVHVFNQSPPQEALDEGRSVVNDKAISYDRSKLAGQEIALAISKNRMETIIINPTGIIGPFDFKPSRTGKALIDLIKGRMPFIVNGGFDFCDSRDVAHAIVNALTMGKAGESYILSGKWYGMPEIKSMLEMITGRKIRSVTISPAFARTGLRLVEVAAKIVRKEPQFTREALDIMMNGNRKIESGKARRELNFSPRPMEETLRDTVGWFRSHGFVK